MAIKKPGEDEFGVSLPEGYELEGAGGTDLPEGYGFEYDQSTLLPGYDIDPSANTPAASAPAGPSLIPLTGGKTSLGRQLYTTEAGELIGDRVTAIASPGLNGGKPTLIPLIHDGRILSEQEAIARVLQNGGKDPETGKPLPFYETTEEALGAVTMLNGAKAAQPTSLEIPQELGGEGGVTRPQSLKVPTGRISALPAQPLPDPHAQQIQPEVPPDEITYQEFVSDIAEAFTAIPGALKSASGALWEGSDPAEISKAKDWADKVIEERRARSMQNVMMEGADEAYVDLGPIRITRADVRNLPENVAFSVASMLAGLTAGGAGFLVGGPVGGFAAGGIGSGTAAYRMSTNQILRTLRDGLDHAAIRDIGRPLSDGEWLSIANSEDMQAAAYRLGVLWSSNAAPMDEVTKYGLHEAGWEAIGNMTLFAAGKALYGLGKSHNLISAKGLAAFTGGSAMEVLTEAETHIGQSGVESRLGLSDKPEPSFLSPKDQYEAVEEVAGPTLLLTGVMGAGAAGAGAAVGYANDLNQYRILRNAVNENLADADLGDADAKARDALTPKPIKGWDEQGRPVMEPATYTAEELVDLGKRRLEAIERKASGTPDQTVTGEDGKPVTVRGEPPQILTDAERRELAFLRRNQGDAEAIAEAYGLKTGESALPGSTQTNDIGVQPSPWADDLPQGYDLVDPNQVAQVSAGALPTGATPPRPSQEGVSAESTTAALEASRQSLAELERLAEQTTDPAVRARLRRDAEAMRDELEQSGKVKLTPWERARQNRIVKPSDDLVTAIRRLGGIDTEQETDWQGRLSHLNKTAERAFGMPNIERPGKGLTLDELAERLHELGYLENYDAHELEERLMQAETGARIYSRRVEAELLEREFLDAMNARGEDVEPIEESDWDDIMSAAWADLQASGAGPSVIQAAPRGADEDEQGAFGASFDVLRRVAAEVDEGSVEDILERAAIAGWDEQATAHELLNVIRRAASGKQDSQAALGGNAGAEGQRGEAQSQPAGESSGLPGVDQGGQGAPQPQGVVSPGGVERRTDEARRKRVADMTPEEKDRELLTSRRAGIWNDRAYEEHDRLPVQVSIDLDGLKWINDNLGHEAGDMLIRSMGDAVRGETDRGYHISGDEFVIQANTEEEAQATIQRINQAAERATITVELPDGTRVTKKGVGFSYGIGQDLAAAETGLQQHKAERERAGLRSARGGEPAGVVRTPPGGEQDRGREAADVPATDEEEVARGPVDAKPKTEQVPVGTPRDMDHAGRPIDKQPVRPGDVFRTASGRVTTPYPKQKSEKYASQWLIDNATAEAESRGDEFNARGFSATTLIKPGRLTDADREGMLEYLFGQQPPVVPSILKPLVGGGGNDVLNQLSSISLDELEAMIDDVAGSADVPDTAKPARSRSKSGTSRSGTRAPRKTRSRPETTDTSKPADVDRAAGEIAKSLGYNLSSAGMEALKGLTELFGGSGKLNSGLTFNEETYKKAKPHFEAMLRDAIAAGKDLRDLIRSILSAFGTGIKPYIMRFAQDVKAGAVDLGGDQAQNQQQGATEGATDESGERSGTDLERDSADAGTGDRMGQEGVSAGHAGGRGGVRPGAQGTDGRGSRPGSGDGVPGSVPAAGGTQGNISLFADEAGSEGSPAASDDGERGGDIGLEGDPIESVSTEAVAKAATKPLDLAEKIGLQKEADTKYRVIPADPKNIEDTLPVLTEGQRGDVLFAERRFAKEDGYGVLFTNGTGTGKTFSGLGIVKRFAQQGKTNTIIVVPSDKIASDWVEAGKLLGLDIKPLAGIRDAGNGIVITTYANFGQNFELINRRWDLIVADESHYFMSNKDGSETLSLRTLRAISMHMKDGGSRRGWAATHKEREERDGIRKQISANIKIINRDDTMDDFAHALRQENEKLEARLDALQKIIDDRYQAELSLVEQSQGEKRPRVVFLSATPFPYEKTVDYAEEYLFQYEEGERGRGYNTGSPFDRFMMLHFGYRMRYNKLNEPGPEVNRGLLQRQFNSWLKQNGVLSSRLIDVPHDYDRRFILVESEVGIKIDEGLEYLRENPRMYPVFRIVLNQFDHLSRRFLLEAIKAREVVPEVREHMARGRKVVVFHDFKTGGGFHPFDLRHINSGEVALIRNSDGTEESVAIKDLVREFMDTRKDLVGLPLRGLPTPIDTFRNEFGDELVIFNGDISENDRREAVKKFQDDNSKVKIILVQSAAGREGISLHDTTGKHQRVLFNLGLPTTPATAIQQEGRIYRIGQQSDAIFRYLNTGTAWERIAFANTIARRSSAVENLALGEEARALMDSFIQAFEESDRYPAGMEGEGKGGKERDAAAMAALSEWDRAKTFYFAQQKKTSKTKAKEGTDYFATPEPVGLKMVELADIRGGEAVLEPSAGHGAIARWFPENAGRTVIEPSSELYSRLRMVTDAKALQERFEDHNIVNKYDAVVMNPPFGRGGKTAIEHLAKAAKHLRDRGRIVALIPTGPAADKRFDDWMYGTDAKGKKADPSSGGMYLVADIKLPPVTFERAGTRVSTRIVVLEKVMDRDEAAKLGGNISRDYSDIQKIGELFDRLEGLELKPRRRLSQQPGSETISAGSLAPQQQGARQDSAAAGRQDAGGFTLAQTRHAKKGIDLYVATFSERVPREVYDRANRIAKTHGGYYSAYKAHGAIPGFQFESEADRAAFLAEFGGGSVQEDRAEYGIDQTETPEFRRWFGDSKVVDENGAPLRVYHATDSDFSVFDDSRAGENTDGNASSEEWAQTARLGFWFSDHDVSGMTYQRAVVPAYLAIENPKRYGSLTWLAERAIPMAGSAKELRAELEADGYDGIVVEDDEEFGGSSFIAFRPEQIKSAVGNTGAFDPNDPNIVREEGVPRDPAPYSGYERAPSSVRYRQVPPGEVTETPEFRRWFGDSKVVDADGKPLVVYHGTRPGNDFSVFEVPSSRDGIYFTPDAEYASSFTEELFGDSGAAGAIYPSYLSVQNPYIVRSDGIESDEAQTFLYRGLDRSELEKQGYDGAMLYLDGELDQIIAFRPEQIKSAIGNRGTFDPEDSNILHEPGEEYRAEYSIDQTETPEFRRWFGDSKVVDADGKPLVVYHGTNRDIEVFGGPIAWTSGDPQHASAYAEAAGELRDGGVGGANVLPVYVSIERPFEAPAGYTNIRGLIDAAVKQAAAQGHPVSDADANHYRASMQELWNRYGMDDSTVDTHHHWSMIGRPGTFALRDMLQQMGFDGIQYVETDPLGNRSPAKTFGVFRPEQIKSATGNRGTFDPEDSNILHEPGEAYRAEYSINQTETPEFRRWFGDSKVVDENGKPLVVYHGTGADISSFRPARGFGGIYFTESRSFAEQHAERSGSATVYPVYLSIQNPKILDASVWEKIRSKVTGKRPGRDTSSMALTEREVADLERQGYDGIINRTASEIVAFRPEQIKSAIGNRGTFSSTDPSIVREDAPIQGALDFSLPAEPKAAAEQLRDNFLVKYRQVETGRVNVGLDRVRNASDAAHVLASFRKHGQEVGLYLVLDAEDRPLAVINHSKGTVDGAGIYPFVSAGSIASIEGAASVWMAHNHPSGVLDPSRADMAITGRIATALEASGIEFRGHFIMGIASRKARVMSADGYMIEEVNITPAPRRKSVPVTERVIRRRPPFDRMKVENPDSARKIVEGMAITNGIVLLDTKHHVVGSLSFDSGEMGRLREGGRVRRILKALGETNSSAGIIVSDKREDAENLVRYLRGALGGDYRILDALVRNPKTGKLDSSAETDGAIISSDGAWMQRRQAAALSRGGPFTAGEVTPETVEALREAARSQLEGVQGVAWEVVPTEAGLPEAIRRDIEQQGASGQVAAVYHNGTIYYVAQRLGANPVALEVATLHELDGHFGFERLFGREARAAANDLYMRMGGIGGIERLAKERGIDFKPYLETAKGIKNEGPRRYYLVHEILAHLQEARAVESLPERIKRAIRAYWGMMRQWLREHGFTVVGTEFTDSDLAYLLRSMSRAARGQGKTIIYREPTDAWFQRKATPPVTMLSLPNTASIQPMDLMRPFGEQAKSREVAGTDLQPFLDRLTGPADAKELFTRTVHEFESRFHAARRGKISWAETEELARSLGMTADELMERRNGQAFNAEEWEAARSIIDQATKEVTEAAMKARGGTDEDLVIFRQRLAKFVPLAEQVIGARAEWGRLGSIMRKQAAQIQAVSDILDAMGGRPTIEAQANAIAGVAESGATPETVRRTITKVHKTRKIDMIIEAWINGLLSGPQTHAVNITSNQLIALLNIPEHAIAAVVGKLHGGTDKIYMREILPRAWGMLTGMREGALLGAQVFSSTAKRLHLARTQAMREGLTGVAQKVRTREIVQKVRKLSGDRPENLSDEDRIIWDIYEQAQVTEEGTDFFEKIDVGYGKAIPGKVGTVIRTPGNSLQAQDEFYKAIAWRMELNSRSMRQAISEGLHGNALRERAEEIARKVDMLRGLDRPKVVLDPQEVMLWDLRDDLMQFARYQTFTNPLGPLGRTVQSVASRWPFPFRFIMPFIRTPVNIVKFAGHRSPLAMLMPSFHAEFKKGGAARDVAIARMLFGTGVSAMVIYLALQGFVTGGGPTDPNKRRVWLQKYKPYSIKIGDEWYSYGRLEPLGMIMGVSADLASVIHVMDEADAEEVAGLLYASVVKNLSSKTFLQGISNAVAAYYDPERYGDAWLLQFAGTAIPTGIAQVARVQDPTLRRAETIIDKWKSRLPGLSKDLMPRRDIFGEPIVLGGGWGPDIVSPVYVGLDPHDPVVDEMVRLGIAISPPQKKLGGIELTPEQYDVYTEIAGRTAKKMLDQFVTQPSYNQLPDAMREQMIENVYRVAREQSRWMLYARYPEIIRSQANKKIESMQQKVAD